LNSKPSKSARKRDYLALQELGEQLIELSVERLQGIGLEEDLYDAVLAARSISSHGALRRQKQLIGKIMRRVDPEPIRAALEAFGKNDRADKQIFREAEGWRDRIAMGGAEDLDAWFTRIGLRNESLEKEVRNLRRAHDDRARKQAKRNIFREIHKDLVDEMQKRAMNI
jgi:ribosome-associated protein